MKALAASSVGQYEQAVLSLVDYQRTVELGLSVCLRLAAPAAPLGVKPRKRLIGAILFGSDQGLVGRFNDILFEFAAGALASVGGEIKRTWAVGDRMYEVVADSAWPKPALLPVPGSVGAIAGLVDDILIELQRAIEQDQIADIHVFHNRPLPGAGYEPTGAQLLPLDAAWQMRLVSQRWPTPILPELIGEPATALQEFIREYFFVLLFRACAESLAGENASRLAAMQRAEKSIEDMRESLVRRFHRSRQESIDEELFEVISGYSVIAAQLKRVS